jgi:hypothetical protein
MSNKSIVDVRAALFDVIAGLNNTTTPMPLDRAKAICETCQVLVNTAKVEVDFLKLVPDSATGFIKEAPQLEGAGVKPTATGWLQHDASTGVTKHRIGH